MPTGQKEEKKLFICTMHRLPHPAPSSLCPKLYSVCATVPRGDESDQSDQSTEITVIPEVRGRAPGHSEFTHPAQASDKSVQEWQTFGRMKLRFLYRDSRIRVQFRLIGTISAASV